MTEIRSTSGAQRARWREQAARIAHELKRGNRPEPRAEDGMLVIGVAFDDGLVRIRLHPDKVDSMTVQQLAAHIHEAVLKEADNPAGLTSMADLAAAMAAASADEGKMMELGWKALKRMGLPAGAGPEQTECMRMAYYAGAQHLFASIMGIMDKGEEPTDRDMRRMDGINKELEAWRKDMNTAREIDRAGEPPTGVMQ